MIDRFAALKAISALNELDSKHFDENSNEIRERTLVIDLETDTNDSFSGVDSEEDLRGIQGATGTTTNQVTLGIYWPTYFYISVTPHDFFVSLCFNKIFEWSLNIYSFI